MTVIVDITEEGHIYLNGTRAIQQPQLTESLLSALASKLGVQLHRKSLLGTFQNKPLDKTPPLWHS